MITSIFAALLGLLFIKLSINTIKLRKKNRVIVGDGGHTALSKAMRAHGNFAEYTPFALVLIYLVEQNYVGNTWLVIILGSLLFLGRIIHACGISQVKENFRFRVVGMGLTFSVLLTACAVLLVKPFL
ncbi:MAPEG family protein [Catenovulum sp. SM1970]|uniref:MAPEG family protein n=1 Tax=Marinifaba aquimaris TaxID=2741323 RepID=UPI0015749223|nr:MAPEG family protein [Marinifaba aquimaris]NTS77057.1 MAPEG family protein [Marinifaba aquimaris]